MIKYNDEIYTGFYEKAVIENVGVDTLVAAGISFENVYLIPTCIDEKDCPYERENGMVFLDGACNLFAKALNDVYGYDVYEVSDNSSTHWYCMTVIDGREVYVDVRGATSDFQKFSERYFFIKNKTEPKPVLQTGLNFDDDIWKDTGWLFAVSVIGNNKGFYGDF